MIHKGRRKEKKRIKVLTSSTGTLQKTKKDMKCSHFGAYCGFCVDESLVYIVWLLAPVRSVSPQSKKGLHLWGLGWDFHFLETPSVLFCMVPPGTTVLIFLEGMFREPQSPRGKDNGGCDVTSILGASRGKEKSWVALMSSGTPFLKEFHSLRAP